MRSRRSPNRRRGILFDCLESRRLLALTLSPINISAMQDVPFSNVVATLVDTNHAASPSDFNNPPGSVQINWGDGVTSSGLVVGPISPGVFYVDASHTYTDSGAYSTLISVNDQSGNSAIASGLATVNTSAPAQLTIANNNLKGSAGTALTGVAVANFLDPDPSDIASNFQALITWGNGNTSIGLIQGGNGAFTVYGTNTYGAQDSYTTNVTVISTDNGLDGVASGTAKIGPSSSYTLTGQQFTENSGAPFTAEVATFTDVTLTDTPADFSATIAWDDGQISQGTVIGGTVNNGVLDFSITGSHVYAAPGTESVTVTLVDQRNNTSFTTSTVNVTGSVLTPLPTTVNPPLDQPFTGIVGSFFDTNTTDNLSTLSAIITWGDGHLTSGTIEAHPGNPELWDVYGTNVYAVAGTYPISIAVASTNNNQSTTIASTALVAASTFIATPTSFPGAPGVPLPPDTVVANFVDTNPNANTQNLTAVINWGDGQATTTGVINSTSSPGAYTVTGTHTYTSSSASGSYAVTVTIVDPDDQTVTVTSMAYVASPLSASGVNLSTSSGNPLPANTVVANFIDTNTNANLQNITASINWGDGQTSSGTIVPTNTAGVYTVAAGHTYAGTSTSGSYTITVTVADSGGPTVTAKSTVIVVPPLTGNGTVFITTPGVLLPPTTIVASFEDANSIANANPSSISALINWGDGQTSVGAIHFVGGSLSLASYVVTGSHTYSPLNALATYPVTVTIFDPSQQQLSVNSTAIVNQYISASGTTITTTVGQPVGTSAQGAIVATFTDSDSAANTNNITAVIRWGDGQTSTGTIYGPSAAGQYTVTGNHTYASEGPTGILPILVTIVDPSGQTTAIQSTVDLTSSVSATGLNFTATVGVPFLNQPVATFYDESPSAAASKVVINWGDGQSTPGLVSGPNSSGLYVVTGNHTYSTASSPDTYSVTVTITDPNGQSTQATSVATVAAPTIAGSGTTFPTSEAVTGVSVASFSDANPSANATNITVIIQWGDGQSSTGIATGPNLSGIYTVSGNHTYAIPSATGSYAVTVTIIDPSGQTATVKSTALVVAQVLSPIPLTVSFTAGTPPSTPVIVGSFYDTNLPTILSTFTVSINWDTGQSSSGTVIPSLSTPGLFLVSGSYLYPSAGTYPLTISVQDNKGNSTTIYSTAIAATNVAMTLPNVGFTGGLSPNGGNGNYAALGYTSTNRPTFSGTAVPFATVQLYAKFWGVDAVQPLGEAVTNASGQWSLTIGPLATGTYTFAASVTPPGGYPIAVNLSSNGLIHIDMKPPKVETTKHRAGKLAAKRRAVSVHKALKHHGPSQKLERRL